MSERWELRIQAFHDGELSAWGRMRVRHRLRGDPRARAQLARLVELGSLLRQPDGHAPEPDLWHAIRADLRPLPAAAPTASPAPVVRAAGRLPAWPRERAWLRWAVPTLAAAAAAVAIVLVFDAGDAPVGPSLRWLDAGGRSAMILQDDREATIIWMLEGTGRVSGGARSAVI